MKTYSIALIGGDGIGPEILREGKKVMDAAAEVAGITWQWKEYPYGAEHWLKYRKGEPTLMREEEMAELGTHDAARPQQTGCIQNTHKRNQGNDRDGDDRAAQGRVNVADLLGNEPVKRPGEDYAAAVEEVGLSQVDQCEDPCDRHDP